jgi:hypothetical protein
MVVTVSVICIEMEMRWDALLSTGRCLYSTCLAFKSSSYDDLSWLPFVVSRMHFTVLFVGRGEGAEMCKIILFFYHKFSLQLE